jgi:CRISPR/Cas system CSM-associated protein Csm2 small subunit
MVLSDCKYTIEDIDKVVEFSTWSLKKKIDTLLRIDCIMYTNLGIDSTKNERLETKRRSRSIYKAIKKLDEVTGRALLISEDKP